MQKIVQTRIAAFGSAASVFGRCLRAYTLALLALLALGPAPGHAAIALLQPPRVVDGTRPLILTLLISADTVNRSFLVPDTLDVIASAELQAPVRVAMRRITPGPSTARLRIGEHRLIQYSGQIPETLRGQVRLDPVSLDAAPVLITLNRAPTHGEAGA